MWCWFALLSYENMDKLSIDDGKFVKVQKSDQTGDWTQDLLDIYQML